MTRQQPAREASKVLILACAQGRYETHKRAAPFSPDMQDKRREFFYDSNYYSISTIPHR